MIDHLDRPDEIEAEIEQTRQRVGRDIDELGERLSPRRLTRRAGPVHRDPLVLRTATQRARR